MIIMRQKNRNNSANAVIYARFSSHGQSEQSIEGQLRDCHAFAEREGYTIIHEYIDRAKSARSDDRPDFQRMIKDAAKKQFQVIIVWKLDRFARNRYDSAIYKAKLKKFGIRVVSVMENITDSPEGIILEGMLESLAEFYSANLSQNVLRGQRETIAKGRWCGGNVPYGYQPVDGRLVEDPRTSPIIKEVFRRYAAGENKRSIISDLNERGIRTSRGKPLTNASFQTALKNPTYIGQHTWKGEVIKGAADALIDEETFERAQAYIRRRALAPAAAKAKVEYQLQGKAFCGMCGARMIGESGYGKAGTSYHYYTCATRKKEHACAKRNEKKGFIEWYVVEQTIEYVLSPDRIDTIAASVVAEYEKEFNDGALKEMERQVEQLDADLNTLVDQLLVVPKPARPRIYERMEQLELQKADTELEISKLRVAVRIRYTEDEVKAWLRQFCKGDPLDEEFRKRIIDVFINSIYLYDDKVVIFYNIKGGKQVSFIDLCESLEDPPDPSDGECSDLPMQSLPKRCLIGTFFVILFCFRQERPAAAPCGWQRPFPERPCIYWPRPAQ